MKSSGNMSLCKDLMLPSLISLYIQYTNIQSWSFYMIFSTHYSYCKKNLININYKWCQNININKLNVLNWTSLKIKDDGILSLHVHIPFYSCSLFDIKQNIQVQFTEGVNENFTQHYTVLEDMRSAHS